MRRALMHPLTVALVGSAISIFACGLALHASSAAKHASMIALNNTREIRASRRNSILVSCREQNEHHDNARALLGVLLSKSSVKPRNQAQLARQHEEIEIFVEAIAPKYDCAKRLAKFTKP